jgi:hypothetical protein
MAVAAAAYIAAGTIEFIGNAAISRLLAPGARLLTVVSLVFGLAAIALAGYFAVRIRAEAATALIRKAGRCGSRSV